MGMLDWLMIALYFGLLLGVAWWVIRKGQDTADDYFLAGRNLGWWVIGASIFASFPRSPWAFSPAAWSSPRCYPT
jgi:SSS family solute:Na+ symporter